MRIGLIARADSRGLGIQTKNFYDALNPAKTMVVDCPSAKPLPLRDDWYPDATWIRGLPTAADFRQWLNGLDVVYTAETAYNPVFWREAARADVRTVLHANFEFLDRNDHPTVWAAPSLWRIDEWPQPNIHLPVPVADKFHQLRQKHDHATRFVHIIGRPAIHDRNGTAILLRALPHIGAEITVTIFCQEAGYVEGLIREHGITPPDNITLDIRAGDVPDNTDLYRGQHVLVLPRRFGGLCLPCNEALAAGLPVIMPYIDPNWHVLPGEWLVSATKAFDFMAKQRVDVHDVDPVVLARKIQRFATDTDFYRAAQDTAWRLGNELSWETLKPRYLDVLGGDSV